MPKLTLPHVGMRTIKTAVGVTLSYLIFVPFGLLYNKEYPGLLGYIGPLYACIPCVVCMQSSMEQSKKTGFSRLIGVLVGAALGTLVILIPEPLLACWPFKAVLLGLSCILGIVFCTYVLHRPAACTMACILPCVMAISGNVPDADRHLYAAARVIETLVGVSMALLVNTVLPSPKPPENSQPPATGGK